MDAFKRFEFPTTGHLYDADGRLLSSLAREHREITRYNEIPSIVRDAVLAAEDERFFSHMSSARRWRIAHRMASTS